MTLGVFKMVKESQVRKRAQTFLKEEKRCLIAREIPIGGEDVFLPRQKRKVNLIGVTKKGKIGQLLFYKALIERDTKHFLRRLRKVKKIREYAKRLKRVDRRKMRYYLVVSPRDKAKFGRIESVFEDLRERLGVRIKVV